MNRECISGIYLGPIRNFGPFYSIRLFRSFCPFPFHSNFKPKEKKKSIFDKWPRPGIHSINFHSISNLWLTLSVPTRTAQKSSKLSHSPTLLQHILFSFFNFFAFHHSLFLSLSLRLVQEKKKKVCVWERRAHTKREKWRMKVWKMKLQRQESQRTMASMYSTTFSETSSRSPPTMSLPFNPLVAALTASFGTLSLLLPNF